MNVVKNIDYIYDIHADFLIMTIELLLYQTVTGFSMSRFRLIKKETCLNQPVLETHNLHFHYFVHGIHLFH